MLVDQQSLRQVSQDTSGARSDERDVEAREGGAAQSSSSRARESHSRRPAPQSQSKITSLLNSATM